MNTHVRDQLLELNSTASAWTTYAPTLTQSATVTHTATVARYKQIGKTVHVSLYLAITGAGTAGNAVVVSLPVTAQQGAVLLAVGHGTFFDAAPATYVVTAKTASTTTVQLFHDTSGNSAFGIAPAVTCASGDVLSLDLTYEAA